jgi:solute:Na+ symporter, SSS family
MGFAVSNAEGVYEIPFLHGMGIVFIICVIVMVIISLVQTSRGVKTNGLEIQSKTFRTSPGLAVGI